jgi:hypothetical protein
VAWEMAVCGEEGAWGAWAGVACARWEKNWIQMVTDDNQVTGKLNAADTLRKPHP